MMLTDSKIDLQNIPRHIAIIMDGNGRWAKKQGAKRVFGHHRAIKAIRDTTEAATKLGVEFLTLYAFSTENWNRPKYEVDALMKLIVHTIKEEIKTFINNKIKLTVIGNLKSLPKVCQRELETAIQKTKNNDGMTLVLALSYSGQWDILEAVKQIASDVKNDKLSVDKISNEIIESYLSTRNIPAPELLIRTSGEMRMSNFLLWQIAYSELFFTEMLWPDFREKDLQEAILSYQKRERRFGMTSEQVVNK